MTLTAKLVAFLRLIEPELRNALAFKARELIEEAEKCGY